MRAVVLCLLVGCSKEPPSPTIVASASAAPSASAPAPPPKVEFAESDFRGTFSGAKLVATLEAKPGTIAGSCFYESVGIDIPLKGTIAEDGTITMSELKGETPVSTITLKRDPDGTLSGTWKSGEKTGAATLAPVGYKPGDAITVATRFGDESSLALCGDGGGDKPKAACRRKTKAPVALGLADRAFEKKLNAALLDRAKMAPPANPEGIGVTTDYVVQLATHGVLSIVFVGNYECGAKKDCGVDAYVPGHKWYNTTSLTAAVDKGIIAKSYSEFVDFSKVVPLIKPIVASGFKMCVTSGPDNPLDGVTDAVLTERGVSWEHDNCGNHVHADAWDLIPYAKLGAALKPGSPFESAWK